MGKHGCRDLGSGQDANLSLSNFPPTASRYGSVLSSVRSTQTVTCHNTCRRFSYAYIVVHVKITPPPRAPSLQHEAVRLPWIQIRRPPEGLAPQTNAKRRTYNCQSHCWALFLLGYLAARGREEEGREGLAYSALHTESE